MSACGGYSCEVTTRRAYWKPTFAENGRGRRLRPQNSWPRTRKRVRAGVCGHGTFDPKQENESLPELGRSSPGRNAPGARKPRPRTEKGNPPKGESYRAARSSRATRWPDPVEEGGAAGAPRRRERGHRDPPVARNKKGGPKTNKRVIQITPVCDRSRAPGACSELLRHLGPAGVKIGRNGFNIKWPGRLGGRVLVGAPSARIQNPPPSRTGPRRPKRENTARRDPESAAGRQFKRGWGPAPSEPGQEPGRAIAMAGPGTSCRAARGAQPQGSEPPRREGTPRVPSRGSRGQPP